MFVGVFVAVNEKDWNGLDDVYEKRLLGLGRRQ